MNKQTILAIGAHPDDMEQFAGGTLRLLVKEGHKVTITPLTDGACGTKNLSAEEIIKIRAGEQKKAAGLLGAKLINLGIRDGCIEDNLETARKIAALIRDVNPQIIITHPTEDYMSDHYETGRLVIRALPEAGHKNFEAPTKSPNIKHHPYVYQTDPQGLTFADGQFSKVNTIVDITDTVEEKLKAFATHGSQIDFMPNVMNAVDKTRRWAVIRGEQVLVEYGEGFNQVLLAQYPRKNILVELLSGKVYTL